jgi:hypothetical protein
MARASDAVLVAAMMLVPLSGVLLAHEWPRIVPSPRAIPAPAAMQSVETPTNNPGPEIHGRILDAEGAAVDGANVRIVSTSPPYSVYRDARSDTTGGFSFSHVERSRVRVVADHDPEGVVSSAELLISEDRSTEITLVLAASWAIRGTVVNADDKPVAGAVLSVEGMPWVAQAATSDESGAFRLTVVPREATSLVAVARGYRTGRAPLGYRENREPGELIVRVRLAAAPPVEGQVVDADGKPVKARVIACGQQPSESRTSSAEDGSFELPAATIGCDAIAEHDAYASSDPTPVLDGSRILLRLKAGGTVTGHVFDEHHLPLAHVDLSYDAMGSVVDARTGAQTGDDGQYRLDRTPIGPFTLRVHKDGFRVRLVSGLRVASGATVNQDVTLVAAAAGPGLELGGIGAALKETSDGMVLNEVFPGDPAARAGLRAGDRVLSIDGEPVDGMSMASVLQRLRGEEGTSVGVMARRPETGENVEATIVRATIVR